MSEIALISDVHIQRSGDDGSKFLLRFLNDSRVQNCSKIIFLGDIFNILVGPFYEYYLEHKIVFDQIKKTLKKQKIIWIEGNHDFHFQGLMEKILSPYEMSNFTYSRDPIVMNNVYFGHGDELDVSNKRYMNYRRNIRSNIAQLFADTVLSYKQLNYLYKNFANKSRRAQTDFDEDKERAKFQGYAQKLIDDFDFKYVVLGHSHLVEKDGKFLNLGLSAFHQHFLIIDEDINFFNFA